MELGLFSKYILWLVVAWARVTAPTPINLPEQHMYYMVYSPDHTKVAFVRFDNNSQSTLVIADAGGGNSHIVFTNQYETAGIGISEIGWSPNGEQLVFSINYFDPSQHGFAVSEIWLTNADGTHISILVHKAHWVFAPIWLTDGKHIAFGMGAGGCNALYVTDINRTRFSYVSGCTGVG